MTIGATSALAVVLSGVYNAMPLALQATSESVSLLVWGVFLLVVAGGARRISAARLTAHVERALPQTSSSATVRHSGPFTPSESVVQG
jgi:hypothetical protein